MLYPGLYKNWTVGGNEFAPLFQEILTRLAG
jgi:hypothetical protein